MRLSGLWRCACLAAALALAGVGLGCGMIPTAPGTLMEQARSAPSAAERRQALAELKGRVEPGMRVQLETILATELDPASRALAADRLGELGDAASGPELSRSVRSDTRGVVRQKALAALGAVLGAGAADDIKYVLHNDPDPEVRLEAVIQARKCLASVLAVPLLVEALSDRAAAVRLEASAMLSELTGLNAAPNPDAWKAALQAAQKP